MTWQGAEQRRQVHRAIMDANPPHIQAVFSPSQVGDSTPVLKWETALPSLGGRQHARSLVEDSALVVRWAVAL